MVMGWFPSKGYGPATARAVKGKSRGGVEADSKPLLSLRPEADLTGRGRPVMVKDFVAYSVGLCQASACTSLSVEEAAVRMNAEHPTGISSRWEMSSDPTFATGQTNPCPCDEHSVTHKHYLFTC